VERDSASERREIPVTQSDLISDALPFGRLWYGERNAVSNANQLGKTLTKNEKPDFMEHMKPKTLGLTLALWFLAVAMCFAADPQMGTWKLNETKSKITPGTTKFATVSFKSMFGQVKATQDGIGPDGKPIHVEWSGKFDGKDYPVTGDPNGDTRSYTKVNDRTLEVTVKKNGKTTVTARSVVSADGKSRSATVTGTTPKGKKFKNVAVYDKQ
jgi:hypothetical protein